MAPLEESFIALEQELRLTPERIAILIAPALTRERVEAELAGPTFLEKLLRHPKEFVRSQFQLIHSWDQYEKRIVLPVLRQLAELRKQTDTTILGDVTFKGFKNVASDDAIQLIFLFAHHIPRSQNQHGLSKPDGLQGALEFADGGRDMELVVRALRNTRRRTHLQLVYIVCQSAGLQRTCYQLWPTVKTIGGAPWNVPLVEGIEFCKFWIESCNGDRTVSEAYDAAVYAMLTSPIGVKD